jgi:hypothetical protein
MNGNNILLRSEKGEPLTHDEMDANFSLLRDAAMPENVTKISYSGPARNLKIVDISNFDGTVGDVKVGTVVVKGNYIYMFDDGYGNVDKGEGTISFMTEVHVVNDGYGTISIEYPNLNGAFAISPEGDIALLNKDGTTAVIEVEFIQARDMHGVVRDVRLVDAIAAY